jgi:hypothetical protein
VVTGGRGADLTVCASKAAATRRLQKGDALFERMTTRGRGAVWPREAVKLGRMSNAPSLAIWSRVRT